MEMVYKKIVRAGMSNICRTGWQPENSDKSQITQLKNVQNIRIDVSQGRYTKDQQVHEKMFNITGY